LHVTAAPSVEYLEIKSDNFNTYFDGSMSSLGSPKEYLGTYLAGNPTVSGLKFTGVTAIGEYAFDECGTYFSTTGGQIKTIDFNNTSGISIGEEAFVGCASLTGISFSGTSKSISIGTNAFQDCISLNGFTTSGVVVTQINNSAFYNCPLTQTGINNIVTMPNANYQKVTDGTSYVL
jgi:hypothetical protein